MINTILQGISGGTGDILDTHDIFPYRIYRDETKEFLINTKGRQNMILTMASSMVSPPMTVSGDGSLRYTDESHIFDTHSNEEKELKLYLS